MSKIHRVLYGSSEGLISLRMTEIINESHKKGHDVVYLDGKTSTQSEISEAIEVGLFGAVEKLVVVHRIGSMKGSEKIVAQDEVPCLFIAGGTLPKILTGVKKKEIFEEPKSYQKEEWCASFLMKMVEGHGKKISPAIATSVVRRVGMDLGVLRWEAFKFKYASDTDELTPKEVVSVLAPLSELDGVHLIDALFSGDPKHFLKVCSRFESVRKGDPTMGVATGLLHTNVLGALEVRLLLKKGLSNKEIGAKIGRGLYFVEKVAVPKARVFSEKKLREILGVLYEAENGVVDGVLGAWERFKVGIVKVMIS